MRITTNDFSDGWICLFGWLLLMALTIAGCSQEPTADQGPSSTGQSEVGNEARASDTVESDSDSSEKVFGKTIKSKMVANVVSVLDGDTIKVTTSDGQELVVRMESIDAPEGNAPFAGLVLEKAKELLEGKDVELMITGKDSRTPPRTLAFVISDEVNMNARMIELGLVRHFKRYSDSKELAALEVKAKEQFLNIWSAGKPIPDGEPGQLKAPLSMLFWNVESGGADSEVIASQLGQLGNHAIVGLCEVPRSAFDIYESSLGDNFDSIRGTHFKEDHLQLIFDTSQLELLSWSEVEEVGSIRMNSPVRSQRSPLVARFKQLDGGTEFYVMVNHLARGDEKFRQQQAAALREWARTRQMPIIAIGDYNFDYEFKNEQGNPAFSEFMRDNIWRWVQPAELIDTNWYDEDGDGQDDYPGSLLDFMFVAGAAKELEWICEVVVRDGDFPDDDKTSDHRPVTLSLMGANN